jgi:hypothetical protein
MNFIASLRSNPLPNCVWKWFQFRCKDMILFFLLSSSIVLCSYIYLWIQKFHREKLFAYRLILVPFPYFPDLYWKNPLLISTVTICFLWRFDQIPGHDLPLRVFAFTLIGHTVNGRTFWTSAQPVAEISAWQYTTLKRDRHRCPLGDSNPQVQHASARRPTF